MRGIKIGLLVLGGLIGLLVLAAVAVLLLVDPNDYRGEIEKRAEQATGRPLRIAGPLDLKLFPWIALQVEDVSLGNPPGYGSSPFLTVKRANVGVKLLPLLHKEIEVRRIALEGLAIELVSRSEEENNWKDLGKSEKSGSTPSGPAPRTTVAGVDIKDASLTYRDEAQKSSIHLTHLNVTTGALGSDAAFPVKMSLDYAAQKAAGSDDKDAPAAPIHFDVECSARLPANSSRVELHELALKGRPGQDGTAFLVGAPALTLDWKEETLAPATLAIRYGELPLEVTASGQHVFSNRVVTGKLTVPKASPRELMKSMGMDEPKARDPRALTSLAVKSDYRLTDNALELTNVAIDLDDSRIRGKLGVDDLDTLALSFDLNIDSINVDRYREPEPPEAAQGKAEPPVDLPVEALRELNATGLLSIGQLTLSDIKLSDMRLPVKAANGIVELDPQARLFGGTYEGDIKLDARAEKLRMTLNDHVRGVDVGALANAALKSKRLVGRGDANFALSGSGKTDQQLIKSLAGKFDLNVRDGAFNGVDLWYELRRAVALVKRAAAPARTEPVRTQFKTMTGSGTLAAGVVRNDDMRIDMDYIKARGKGTLAVESQAVDYRVVVEVYKLPPAGEAPEMADLKAVDVPVSVTGKLSDMKIRPDVGDLLKAKVRKEVDKRKDDLKKKLDDKLKGLLNR